jgi:hypothetical protein
LAAASEAGGRAGGARESLDWDVKNLMLVQSVLEIILVALLIVSLRKSGRLGGRSEPAVVPEKLAAGMERFLTESERISETFQATLKDKKDLTTDLILKLDRRLADYRTLMEEVDEAVRLAERRLQELGGAVASAAAETEGKANPAAPEVRAMVLQLAKKGLSVEDIAVRSRLHRGEVELIIDLESQFGL